MLTRISTLLASHWMLHAGSRKRWRDSRSQSRDPVTRVWGSIDWEAHEYARLALTECVRNMQQQCSDCFVFHYPHLVKDLSHSSSKRAPGIRQSENWVPREGGRQPKQNLIGMKDYLHLVILKTKNEKKTSVWNVNEWVIRMKTITNLPWCAVL
jgi:hypothetical protein